MLSCYPLPGLLYANLHLNLKNLISFPGNSFANYAELISGISLGCNTCPDPDV